jgi:hypothetical protein
MKKMLFLVLLATLCLTENVKSQVKIGDNTAPRKGAILDLNGTVKGGLLLPNVEINDVNAIPNNFIGWNAINLSELAGLLVYNSVESPLVPKGVYVWNGAKWIKVNCPPAPKGGVGQ